LDFQTVDWGTSLLAILPEILLTLLAVTALVMDAIWPASRRRQIGIICGVSMFGIVLVLLIFSAPVAATVEEQLILGGMFRHDALTQIFRTMIILAGGLTCLLSVDVPSLGRKGHYYALLIIATLGASLMSAASDLIMAFVALETTSITLYMLAGFLRNDERSAEAGVKYFLFGAVMSAILLYGLSLLYGFSGQTNFYLLADGLEASGIDGLPVLLALVMLLAGFSFKISAVPFHFWTPDVYEGAPTPVTAFLSVASKAASFALLLRLFMAVFPEYDPIWTLLLAIASIVTMTLGNVLALRQTNVKRMLAYSSIAHAGYLLTGVGAMGWAGNSYPGHGVMVYLAAYTFMNLGAFGLLTYLKTQMPHSFDYSLKQMAGLGRRSPWAAVLLSLFLLSLTGIPGTAGFIGKFYVFSGVVWADLWWLAVICVLLSVVSAYYYLRVIIYMFFREPEEEYEVREPISGGMAASLAVSAVATVVIGILPSWLWDSVASAFNALFD